MGNLVLSKADFESINAAIGRMIASVPESKTMAVYDAFSALVGADVPAYLMSTVNEADAKKAYGALMDFKDAVKANPITATAPETPAALSGKLGAIDGAAGRSCRPLHTRSFRASIGPRTCTLAPFLERRLWQLLKQLTRRW